jgi:hypothetical protein
MAHKEAMMIYFDVEGTIWTSVDIAELCEFAADVVTVAVPYSLRTDWRSVIATRVIQYILYDHPHKEKIADILIKNDKFQMIRRDDNAEDDNCSRGTAFRPFLETTIGSNKTFRVAVLNVEVKLPSEHGGAKRFALPLRHRCSCHCFTAFSPSISQQSSRKPHNRDQAIRSAGHT